MTSLPGPQTFPCAAAAATCTASRATCRRLLASGLSATARTARRSRIFSSAPTCSMLPAVRTSFRCHRVACNLPPARMHCGACASPKKFSGGTRIVAKLRSPMAPLLRDFRLSVSFILSWILKRTAAPAMKYLGRRCAGSTNALPSGAAGGCAAASTARHFRPAGGKGVGLVDARAWRAEPVVRRSHRCAALGAARGDA